MPDFYATDLVPVSGDHLPTVYDDGGGSGSPWWGDLIARGVDVVGAAVGRGQYVSPDDPRYRRGGYYGSQPLPVGGGVSVGGGVTPRGVNAGFNVSTNTLLIAGAVLAFFLLGKGKR